MRILLALAVGALTASVPRDADNSAREEQLLGEWRDRKTPRNSIRFLEKESVFLMNGKPSPADGLTGAYSIDWSKHPVAVDFLSRTGNRKYQCILQIEGDRLTLAIPLNGGPRPTDFTPAGKAVLSYERIRK